MLVVGPGGRRGVHRGRRTPPPLPTRQRHLLPGVRPSQWARLVSNQRPLACEASALPLSYAPFCPANPYCLWVCLTVGSPAAHLRYPSIRGTVPRSGMQGRAAGDREDSRDAGRPRESSWDDWRLLALEKQGQRFLPQERTAGKPTTRRYSMEEKAAAVRMVRALRAETGVTHGAVTRVALQLGYGTESVRTWVKQAGIDEGVAPGVTSDETARVSRISSRRCVSCVARTRFASARRCSSGRSSTASSAGSGVHRRQQGRRRGRQPARGRAHLQGAADGFEHLLRRPQLAAVGACGA